MSFFIEWKNNKLVARLQCSKAHGYYYSRWVLKVNEPLTKLNNILLELKNEEQYKAGEQERIFYDFHQLLPEEEERAVITKQLEEETERIELEQSIEQRQDYIRHVTDEISKHIVDMGIVLFFPHTMKDAYRKTGDIADKMELTCKDRKITKIKPEMLEILHFEIDNPLPEEFLEYLFNKEILIFLMKLADTDTRAPEEVLQFFWKTVACASSK